MSNRPKTRESFKTVELYKQVTISTRKLNKLLSENTQNSNIYSRKDKEGGGVHLYLYRNNGEDIVFAKKSKEEKNKWQLLISLFVYKEEILKRKFYSEIGADYRICSLSNEQSSKLQDGAEIYITDTIHAPDECRIKDFDEDTGEVAFVDYVEGMYIEPKKLKYRFSDVLYFKEPFRKDSKGNIIYKYPCSDDTARYSPSITMKTEDIRYVGSIVEVSYKANKKTLIATFKVRIIGRKEK